MTESADDGPDRDPQRPARLLLAERGALLPILRRSPAEAFDRPTACPGWLNPTRLFLLGALAKRGPMPAWHQTVLDRLGKLADDSEHRELG